MYTVEVYNRYDTNDPTEYEWDWIRGISMPDPFTAYLYARLVSRCNDRVVVRRII